MSIKIAIFLTVSILFTSLATIAIAQDNPWDNTWNDEAAAGFLGLGLLCCILAFLMPIIIGLLIGIWVYKDAEKRGKSGAIWLIINILLPLLGLIIWLVVRPPIGGEKPAEPDRKCPNCGRPIPMDAKVCPYCAKKFDE